MIVPKVSFFARSRRRMRYEPRFYRQYPLSCPAAVCGGPCVHHQGRRLFVDAATWIAEASGIPKFIIGATVVSFATTMPEMLVSVFFRAGGQCGHRHRQCRRLGDGQYRPDHVPVADLHGVHHAAAAVCGQGGAAARGDRGSVWLHARRAVVHPESVLILVIFVCFIAESLVAARREQSLEAPEQDARPKTDGRTVALNIGKFVFGAAYLCLVRSC